MERMDRDRANDKLDPLWAEYREACPDPDPSASFMPQLWQRIDNRPCVPEDCRRALSRSRPHTSAPARAVDRRDPHAP